MMKAWALFFLSFVISAATLLLVTGYFGIDLNSIYTDKIRPYIFTGFLTIGGFLLSLQIFILISLKEKLYESDAYKKIYYQTKAINPDIRFYGSLINLGRLLIACVGLSLVTSFVQISFGVIGGRLSSVFCMSLAYATLALIFFALIQIRGSLNIWFKYLEKVEPKAD